LIGVALVAAGVLGGEALPWFQLKFSEITLVGLDFNLGLALLALCGISVLFTIASLMTRDRVYAVSSTVAAMLTAVAMADYYFNASEILALPKAEVARAGWGYFIILIGSGVMFLGTLWVFASEALWEKDRALLRVAVILNGAIIDERFLLEQKDLIIGGKPRRSFFETGIFFLIFAICTGVIPALVFGPMIADYAAQRRNRRFMHIPNGKFPDGGKLFVVDRKRRAKVGLVSGLEGKVSIGGDETSVGEFVKKHTGDSSGLNYISLGENDWGILKFEQLNVFFQMTPIDERVPKKSIWAFDRNVAATTALSALVQIGLILMTLFYWKETAVTKKQPDVRKLMQVEIETTIEEEEEPLEEEGIEEDDVGKKAEGEEGKFGDPDIEPEKESKVPKRDGKMVDKIDPKKVGLNDLLSNSKSNAISSILSSDTSAFSNKIAVAMSGTGSELVIGHGSGGMGFKGTGTGGGGTGGFGRIHGLGEIDTGGGKGVTANLGKKAKKKVGQIKLGSGSSQGFCKKSDIVSVVRRRSGAIRACYEQELQIRPNLQGKLTVRWTITGDGGVTSATTVESTLGNASVENCVLRTIRRMRFAKPEGGVCVIQWPFVFNSGG
jgi:TonB family protein